MKSLGKNPSIEDLREIYRYLGERLNLDEIGRERLSNVEEEI